MKPLISVFIIDKRKTCANTGDYALDALRQQTFAPNMEIFFVTDTGNPTRKINLGRGRGKYILVTDTDNIYFNDAIEQMATLATDGGADALLFNIRGTWESEHDIRNTKKIPMSKVIPFVEYHIDTIIPPHDLELLYIKSNSYNGACMFSRKLLARNKLLRQNLDTINYLGRTAILHARKPRITSKYMATHIIAPTTGNTDIHSYTSNRIREFQYARAHCRRHRMHDIANIIDEHLAGLMLNNSVIGRGTRLVKHNCIKKIGIHLVDHCNLNCKSCSHFSCLARPGDFTLTPRDCARQLRRLAQLTRRHVEIIELLGGEPLLHPDVVSIMRITRKYFPRRTTIRLITNGTLLTAQSADFWRAARKYNILIAPTKYPVPVDWDSVDELTKKYGVKLSFFGGTSYYQKHLYHKPLDLTGNQDILHSYLNCSHTTCITLYMGRIYHCPVCAYIKYFNRQFNQNLQLLSADYIDIFNQNPPPDDIYEFCARPVPFCRYCASHKTTTGHPWTTSKKEISEWTLNQQ